MNYEKIRTILGDRANTTGSRGGFYEFLVYIEKNNPTRRAILNAVDMHLERARNAIHEDIILVRWYLEEYIDKLFKCTDGRYSLTDTGKELLKALK